MKWVEDIMARVNDMSQNPPAEKAPGKPTCDVALWRTTSPQIEKALDIYNRLDSPELPEKAVFRASRRSCRKDFEEILDAIIDTLESSGASECRTQIRILRQDLAESVQRGAEYREQMHTASCRAALTLPYSLWNRSRESIQEALQEEAERAEDIRRQIEEQKLRFCQELCNIGIDISSSEAEGLLSPVSKDDLVAMAGAITHVLSILAQLEQLMSHSGEAPEQTFRYYGMYLLLVYAIDRLQARFVQQIDETVIPRLHAFEKEARENIQEARRLISAGGHREHLKNNIAVAQTTIDACRLLVTVLQEQRAAVVQENIKTKSVLAVSRNTYHIVKLSLNVAQLISGCVDTFRTLSKLRIPELKLFQNFKLREEMQRLSERLAE